MKIHPPKNWTDAQKKAEVPNLLWRLSRPMTKIAETEYPDNQYGITQPEAGELIKTAALAADEVDDIINEAIVVKEEKPGTFWTDNIAEALAKIASRDDNTCQFQPLENNPPQWMFVNQRGLIIALLYTPPGKHDNGNPAFSVFHPFKGGYPHGSPTRRALAEAGFRMGHYWELCSPLTD